MSTATTLLIHSADSAATERCGERLGQILKGGEVIELIGDLGTGKTTFVRGLARGLGSQDHVASPTFTVNRQYRAPHLTLQHFDFYRLLDPGLARYELAEVIDDPKNVIVIEWAEAVKDVLPKKRLTIELEPKGDEARDLKLSGSKELNYIIEAMNHVSPDR